MDACRVVMDMNYSTKSSLYLCKEDMKIITITKEKPHIYNTGRERESTSCIICIISYEWVLDRWINKMMMLMIWTCKWVKPFRDFHILHRYECVTRLILSRFLSPVVCESAAVSQPFLITKCGITYIFTHLIYHTHNIKCIHYHNTQI